MCDADIANLNGLVAHRQPKVAVKCHKSDLPVVFTHWVLFCLVGGDLWCSGAEHHQPPWVRSCLGPVGEGALWASAELGWYKAVLAARSRHCRAGRVLRGLARSWGPVPGLSLTGRQLQMLLQLSDSSLKGNFQFIGAYTEKIKIENWYWYSCEVPLHLCQRVYLRSTWCGNSGKAGKELTMAGSIPAAFPTAEARQRTSVRALRSAGAPLRCRGGEGTATRPRVAI